MQSNPYYKRAYVLIGITVLITLIYSIRLFTVQIIDQSTKEKSANNAQLRQTVFPARGLIYDRHGELLVSNQPIYDVMLVVREMNQQFDTTRFCQALHIDSTEFCMRMTDMQDRKKNNGFSVYTPQLFMGQLRREEMAELHQQLYLFPGVSIRNRPQRDYTYPIACHILGSIGQVNQDDMDQDPYYTLGDFIGKDGVERTYETQLRGHKGVQVLMRDAKGKIHGSYHDGQLDRDAIAGIDLYLTIDRTLQQLAETLLTNKVGSIVAIEPHTGEILTMASAPGWNPRNMIGKQRSAYYQYLLNEPNKPLLNRATQAQYSPGSTFKTLQALTAQQLGHLSAHTQYPCNGPASTPIRCTHNHTTPVDLETAIEQSCNPFFWAVFRDLMQQNGYGTKNADFKALYAAWRECIMSFGLGHKFENSDIPDQETGFIPNTTYYDKIYGSTGWKAITIHSLSIGQGEILVTPLQLANQAAIIANKGYYITPHLNRNDSVLANHINYTKVDSTYFEVVQQGMARVMTNGTGRWYNIPNLHICGKTGTVQNIHGEDHAIFIGFAPYDNPLIAVAVVVENAGFGATWACPLASLVMEQYLTGHIQRQTLLDHMIQTNFIDTIKNNTDHE